MRCIAIVVAAGRGSRFGGERPKQYADLAGRPVLRRAVEALLAHPAIDAVRTVIDPAHGDLHDEATRGLDLPPPVAGGATRQESVRLGLESLAATPPRDVLIHDAARPLVSPALIGRVVAALGAHEAVLPALPVADTLKRVAGDLVVGEQPREGLARAQTPQAFRYAPILAAHRAMAGAALTDDTAVASAAGMSVHTVPGEERNLKITTADDLAEAQARLAAGRHSRTGMGFDVHRLAPGRRLVLGGVAIPHALGLEGHSDADVVLHALTDALLGAIAAGDIGEHFSPADPRWKGADSALFLAHARDLVAAAGGVIEHVDLTLLCERPRIAPYRDAMRARIAAILGLDPGQVSVKATTMEGLGLVGREEGIAAQAVATVAFLRG